MSDSNPVVQQLTVCQDRGGTLLEKLARELPRLASNATLSHSLHSTGKKSLTPEAVADNIIKPAEVDHAESPLNHNMKRTRSTGDLEK